VQLGLQLQHLRVLGRDLHQKLVVGQREVLREEAVVLHALRHLGEREKEVPSETGAQEGR
jgi:hypothetical protein